jgi:hypothetical protein
VKKIIQQTLGICMGYILENPTNIKTTLREKWSSQTKGTRAMTICELTIKPLVMELNTQCCAGEWKI